jgi:hypothetical protein
MPVIQPSLAEIEDRIAVAKENLRELTEQAAASLGEADDERAAERLAEQERELKTLEDRRDEVLKGNRT